jgi:hypothetical protein
LNERNRPKMDQKSVERRAKTHFDIWNVFAAVLTGLHLTPQ